ncbi:hypothetical protein O181_001812 [Austropuccinia psidii MF-1]|uniref:Uncharacterized protein n=1 Tax=Austropuccinia psidii MF-1 TaxID=1389203 RepID=A0A9Q3BBC4_9BASI|nr:hypothetical protein [Austropuccinia psidii MF-1]
MISCPLHTSKTLESKETSQRKGHDCSDLESQGLESIINGKTLRISKQDVQPAFTPGGTWGNILEDISQRKISQRPYGNHQRLDSQQPVQTLRREGKQEKEEPSHNQGYRRAMDPEREYSDSFRLTRSRQAQLSSGFTPLRFQKNSGQEVTILQNSREFPGEEKDQRATKRLILIRG